MIIRSGSARDCGFRRVSSSGTYHQQASQCASTAWRRGRRRNWPSTGAVRLQPQRRRRPQAAGESRFCGIPAAVSDRLAARCGRVPGRFVFSRRRWRHAVRHVAAWPRDRFRHAATPRNSRTSSPTIWSVRRRIRDLLTVYGLLDSPSVTGAYRFMIDVADTLSWISMRRCTRARPSSGSASRRAPACFSTDRMTVGAARDWRPRSTIRTACRSTPAPESGCGGRWSIRRRCA